jgi:PAS domain S-box-containing protein
MKKVDKSEAAKLKQMSGDLIIAKKELAYQTKGELIKELQKLQLKYDTLKASHSKDITGHKLSEEALHMSKEKYRSLIEQSPDGVVISDEHGNIALWNKGTESITGLHACDTIGAPLWKVQAQLIPDEIKTPELLEQLRTGMENIIKSKIDWQGESREQTIICADGKRKTVQDSSFIIKTNNTVRIGTILRDITERKQAENNLKRFQLLSQNSRDIILFIRERDLKILDANEAALKAYGYSREELMRKSVIDLRHPETVKDLRVQVNNANTEGLLFETIHCRRDGKSFPVEVSSCGMTLDEDRILLSIIRDITERRQAEEELRKSNKLLEDLHKHLIEIRENEHTRISREIHDQLGQSLTALKIDMTWLREKIAKESEESIKLNEMIELVNATSIDVHRISSELRPLMLDDLGLAATLEWYCEGFANRTGLKVQMEIEDIQTENMNKNLSIYRVAQESLTNIFRHANAKKVQIKLQKIKKDIVLIIQDDGIGISPDKIRSSNSLGLLGMSERVNQSGGHMEILTPAKGGTKVRVYIPMK